MKPVGEGLKIVGPEDIEFSKRAGSRPQELLSGDEGSPEQLMDLLGDIDSLKVEIHERIRRMEAVKQAKSVLLEDAVRTEALSKKLAEIGKLMSESPMGRLAGLSEAPGPLPGRGPVREDRNEADGRAAVSRLMSDAMALSWPSPEDAVGEIEGQSMDPAKDTGEPTDSEKRVQGDSVAVALSNERLEEISARLADGESSLRATRDEFGAMLSDVRGEIENVAARLRGLEQQERTPEAGLSAVQDTVRRAIEALEDRVAESEQNLRRSEQAELEAKRLLEESSAQLLRAAKVEEQTAARILATEASFLLGIESATQRMAEAEQIWKQKDQTVLDSKKQLDQATFALTQAHAKEESATADLVSARQELTTAYQFAAVSAQRRLDASEFFRKAAFWAVLGTAFSWVAMVWAAWFSMRSWLPIWAPAVGTLVIIVIAVSFSKRGKSEALGD